MEDVKITNNLEQFLRFYDKATIECASSDRRFQLWKKYYGFASVPPGDIGEQLVKEMLDYAWDKYSLVYDRIKYWEPDFLRIHELTLLVKEKLHYSAFLNIEILFFVGTFESEPFIKRNEDQSLSICFPVESDWSDFRLSQEIANAVHCLKSGLSPNYGRTLAQVIFQEGIALHTTQQVMTVDADRDTELLWGHDKCSQEPNRIMMNLIPYLSRSDYEAIYSFTKGTGASGYEREANFTGWLLVKHLLNKGYRLEELASIPQKGINKFVEQSLFSLLDHAFLIQAQE
ncbi:hypothetical protein MUN89_16770 [Halobacillus salinarum]|uniref:Uncharacterized protein n=1 Tax=Halobacillus salinarum TaxID=2932257 RepID=A0ABY4EHB8_9BACI|nr:hypothetical protein [Halobacillus salinarum]UOQ43549.1 hypothetical protein MUN89_16770 [Halobacillus salinarum]